jgi:hypothetical protein
MVNKDDKSVQYVGDKGLTEILLHNEPLITTGIVASTETTPQLIDLAKEFDLKTSIVLPTPSKGPSTMDFLPNQVKDPAVAQQEDLASTIMVESHPQFFNDVTQKHTISKSKKAVHVRQNVKRRLDLLLDETSVSSEPGKRGRGRGRGGRGGRGRGRGMIKDSQN